MAGWFGGTSLYYPPQELSARLELMTKVKRDDVIEVARDILTPDHLAIAAVGSLSKARLNELRGVIDGWQ
jgi:predicted Zn-dependent peptidase